MNYQEVVIGLEEFFAKRGCVIQEPYVKEVAARLQARLDEAQQPDP